MKDSGKRVWKGRELDGALWKEGLWRQLRITWKNSVHTQVDIEALERLMEPENEVVSLGRENAVLFSSFFTQQRKGTTSCRREEGVTLADCVETLGIDLPWWKTGEGGVSLSKSLLGIC